MAIVLVNFATRNFRRSQRLNGRSGLQAGRVDEVRSFSPRHIDLRFRWEHREILRADRGAGFWLWKPYFIRRELEGLRENDWLFYSDSGAVFLESVHHLVRFASERDLDLLVFELPFLERRNTKRDAFVLLECDDPRFTETRQRLASFSLWRASARARSLASEWLHAAQDERALTDLDNQLGASNYPGFVEHRHDQSIFSLVTKKADIPAFRNPSQFGGRLATDYPDCAYPQILHHTRSRGIPVRTRLRATIARRAIDLSEGRLHEAFSFPSVLSSARRPGVTEHGQVGEQATGPGED